MNKKTFITITATFGIIVGGLGFNMVDADEGHGASESLISEETINLDVGKPKVVKEQSTEDFKSYIHTFKKKADKIKLTSDTNELEEKWMKRLYVQKSIDKNNNLTQEEIDLKELKKEAKEKAKYEKTWIKLAKQEYGIKITKKEVDQWIEQGPDASPTSEQLAYAESLGLTLEQLNHEYDRDHYEKWVVWEKLAPILSEKYGVDESDFENVNPDKNTEPHEMSLNNKLNYLYDLEVKEALNN